MGTSNPYEDRIDNINAQQLDGASLSTDKNLGASDPSDLLIPTEKAVKQYVDTAITGGVQINHASLYNLEFENSMHSGFQKKTIQAATAPTVDDDSSNQFYEGDLWHDTAADVLYVCKDNSTGAAVWKEILTEDTDINLDNKYYTETELDSGQLDNRYYTETELDAGQLDTRYYTETELDAGQLDTRYYTESEVDVKADEARSEKRQTALYGATTLDRATPVLPNVADFLYAGTKGTPSGNTLTLDATTKDVVLSFAREDYNYKSRLSANKTIDTTSLPNGTHYVYAKYLSPTTIDLITSMIQPEDDYANMKARNSLLHFDNSFVDLYGHANLQNGVSFSATSKFGTHSADFNADGDYVLCGISSFGSGSWAIECWAKIDSISGNRFIFSGSTQYTFQIYVASTGKTTFSLGNGSSWSIGEATGSYTWTADGNFRHVVLEYNQSTGIYKLYINGVEDISISSASIIASFPAGYRIGSDASGTDSWFGQIDDVRVTIGGVRYGQAFTPPTQAFTADAEHFDPDSMTYYVDGITRATSDLKLPIGRFVKSGGAITSVDTFALRGKYYSGVFAVAQNTTYDKSHNIGSNHYKTIGYANRQGEGYPWSEMYFDQDSPSIFACEAGQVDKFTARVKSGAAYTIYTTMIGGNGNISTTGYAKLTCERTY